MPSVKHKDFQVTTTYNSPSEAFDAIQKSDDFRIILHYFRQILDHVGINSNHSTNINNFYPKIKSNLKNWKAQQLWELLDKKINKKIYDNGNACMGLKVLIIGAGPSGLRAAVEAQFLGAEVTVVEKREEFARNNVLRLWSFIITDLKDLGAKLFHSKLGSGDIEHISIRRLQAILLKIALLLGVQVFAGTSYEDLVYPTNKTSGWKAKFSPRSHPANQMEFNVLICADGNNNSVKAFEGSYFRATLAIAITANFVNRHTNADYKAKEISGVSAIYTQELFKNMKAEKGIDLENIVYFRDDTHYFVMTAKKQSLLNKGVIINDTPDPNKLLNSSNLRQNKLIDYAKEAALYATENQLPKLELEKNHKGKDDVAIFDFTNLWKADNACRMIERNGHKLLMCLIGDSLLESFWPTGTGCAKGFFSGYDTCWMLKQWKAGKMTPLEVIAERERLFKLLPQMTAESIKKIFANYSLDPTTRYNNINKETDITEFRKLLDTDDPKDVKMSSRESFDVRHSLSNPVTKISNSVVLTDIVPDPVTKKSNSEIRTYSFPDPVTKKSNPQLRTDIVPTAYKTRYIILHLIQLVVSLVAILILLTNHGILYFTADCQDAGQNNYINKADIGFSLSLESISPTQEFCYGNMAPLKVQGNYSLHYIVFVGVGILSTLAASVMLLKDLLQPKVAFLQKSCMFYFDLAMSVLFLIFWVISSVVLIQAVVGYIANTQFNVKDYNSYSCPSNDCHPGQAPIPLILWMSVSVSFLCMFLYLLNVTILFVEKRRLKSDTSSKNSDMEVRTSLTTKEPISSIV